MNDKMISNVITKKPMVHCITNNVTINDVANIVLAAGGSPIMADDPKETGDITRICNALVLNMGIVSESVVEGMIIAGKESNRIGNPVILDPVGVGASTFRNETAERLLKEVKFDVIRGNISEIKFLALGNGSTKGVDADESDKITSENIIDNIALAKRFSEKTGAVIAMTGEIDIVADSSHGYVIYNGNSLMAKVTGTGCMLSGVIGAYVGANKDRVLEAVTCAISAMGYCGEVAYQRLQKINGAGTSTYRTFIIDAMSLLSDEELERGNKVEKR